MICTALIREVKAKAIELWEDCGEGCSYKKATEPPHAGAFGSLVSDIFQVPVDLRRSRVCVCVCVLSPTGCSRLQRLYLSTAAAEWFRQKVCLFWGGQKVEDGFQCDVLHLAS